MHWGQAYLPEHLMIDKSQSWFIKIQVCWDLHVDDMNAICSLHSGTKILCLAAIQLSTGGPVQLQPTELHSLAEHAVRTDWPAPHHGNRWSLYEAHSFEPYLPQLARRSNELILPNLSLGSAEHNRPLQHLPHSYTPEHSYSHSSVRSNDRISNSLSGHELFDTPMSRSQGSLHMQDTSQSADQPVPNIGEALDFDREWSKSAAPSWLEEHPDWLFTIPLTSQQNITHPSGSQSLPLELRDLDIPNRFQQHEGMSAAFGIEARRGPAFSQPRSVVRQNTANFTENLSSHRVINDIPAHWHHLNLANPWAGNSRNRLTYDTASEEETGVHTWLHPCYSQPQERGARPRTYRSRSFNSMPNRVVTNTYSSLRLRDTDLQGTQSTHTARSLQDRSRRRGRRVESSSLRVRVGKRTSKSSAKNPTESNAPAGTQPRQISNRGKSRRSKDSFENQGQVNRLTRPRISSQEINRARAGQFSQTMHELSVPDRILIASCRREQNIKLPIQTVTLTSGEIACLWDVLWYKLSYNHARPSSNMFS